MTTELDLGQKISEAGELLHFQLPSQFFAEQILDTLGLLAAIRRTDLDHPEGLLTTDMLCRAGLVSLADLGVRTQPTSRVAAVVVLNPRGEKSGGPHLNDHTIVIFASDLVDQNMAVGRPMSKGVEGSQIVLGEATKGGTGIVLRANLVPTYCRLSTIPAMVITETYRRV